MEPTMDRSLTTGGNTQLAGSTKAPTDFATGARIESAAQSAHQTVDKVADTAASQLGRLSGAAHQAVNSAAGAAASAAEWASEVPKHANEATVRMSEAACASIRARPIATVAGALVVGYLLGRLARF
jgi:hypothetical protein